MISSTARNARTARAAAGVTAIAAVVLAGCTPPHQNPSDLKVDTAETQAADSLASSGKTGQTSAASATNVAEASAIRESATASETATAVQASDKTPLVDNCGDTGLERPGRLNLDCKESRETLDDIVWDTWDEKGATGTATRITKNPDRVIEDSKVSLGGPQVVDGRLVFTVITVDGTPINPESRN